MSCERSLPLTLKTYPQPLPKGGESEQRGLLHGGEGASPDPSKGGEGE